MDTKIQFVLRYPGISTNISREEVASDFNPPAMREILRFDTWDAAHAHLYGVAEKQVGKARAELATALGRFEEIQKLQKP
jgi:hypothetical protein